MKILVVGYFFGAQAEGICTKRIVDALHHAGAEVRVLSSWEAAECHADYEVKKIKMPRWVLMLAKVLNPAMRVIGLDRASYFLWMLSALFVRIDWKFDVIYGRSSPIASLFVAAFIGKKYGIKRVWAHFSDPVPSPFDNQDSIRYKLKKLYASFVFRNVDGVTYTSSQAASYHMSMLNPIKKVQVLDLPHVKPVREGSSALDCTNKGYFLYVGSVYQERSPFQILCAFSDYKKKGGRGDIVFLGGGGAYLESEIERAVDFSAFDFREFVKVEPYSVGVDAWINCAQALLVFDAFSGAPVFLTTKFVEYMAYKKPVLLISPNKSPASEYALLDPSVVCVHDDSRDKIAVGFDIVSNLTVDDTLWDQRKKFSSIYDPSVLAKKLLNGIENVA